LALTRFTRKLVYVLVLSLVKTSEGKVITMMSCTTDKNEFSAPSEWFSRKFYGIILYWPAIHTPRFDQIDPVSEEIYAKTYKKDHYNIGVKPMGFLHFTDKNVFLT